MAVELAVVLSASLSPPVHAHTQLQGRLRQLEGLLRRGRITHDTHVCCRSLQRCGRRPLTAHSTRFQLIRCMVLPRLPLATQSVLTRGKRRRRTGGGAYYRHDGVRITHNPYAPDMAAKYGEPGETDGEGFDPYADSVGAGIYSGTVSRREQDGSVVVGKQYQNHNPRPGPVYSGGGYTPVSRAIATFRSSARCNVQFCSTQQ